jgi:hypothetical protein
MHFGLIFYIFGRENKTFDYGKEERTHSGGKIEPAKRGRKVPANNCSF